MGYRFDAAQMVNRCMRLQQPENFSKSACVIGVDQFPEVISRESSPTQSTVIVPEERMGNPDAMPLDLPSSESF